MKITFDDFLKPTVTTWRASLSYMHFVAELPTFETDLISTWTYLWWVHPDPDISADDYTSESDFEVDMADAEEEEDPQDDDGQFAIMEINGVSCRIRRS